MHSNGRVVPAYWMLAGIISLCFLATGFAGLVYEIIWNRTLTLRMGNTSYALASLLTVFMGGLALGAWVGGRFRGGHRSALRLYGVLEIGVGLYCWAIPTFLEKIDPIFAALYQNHYQSLWRFSILQLLLAGGLLLVPTTLMGATLPILTQFIVRRLGSMSSAVGWLYAVNAAGAGAGALAAGFWLLPRIGIESAYLVAIALNLGAGAIALCLSLIPCRESENDTQPSSTDANRPPTDASPEFNSRGVILAAFGLSGFAAMVYQIAWTRAFSVTIGSYTYAFSLIAGAFICGLTIGSLALGWTGDRRWGRHVLVALPMMIALTAVMTVALLADLPVATAQRLAGATSFAQLQQTHFAVVFGILLIPTGCMGGMLPIVSRAMAGSSRDAGRAVGSAYGANALGTILGSFAAGFVLIPWIGMRGSILLGATLSVAVSILFLRQVSLPAGARREWASAGLAGVGLLAILIAPRWDRAVLASGPYINFKSFIGQQMSDEDVRARLSSSSLAYYKEGVSSLVTVIEAGPGRRAMFVDGRSEAGTGGATQLWLGHLPMLLHPDANDVLVVGLGSGETASAVAAHSGPRHIDVVEIAAEVAEAAARFFADATNHVLDDPRVNLIVGDGRLHLQYTDRTYDVVISQPSTPWVAGAASLFTRESFELMKRRLRPDGVACIWFQGFHIPPEQFRVLARTWALSWSHPSIWMSPDPGNYVLIGSQSPITLNAARIDDQFAFQSVRNSLGPLGIRNPADVAANLMLQGKGLESLIDGSIVNTDDNSRVEFDLPRGLWKTWAAEIFLMLHEHRTDPCEVLVGAEATGTAESVYRDCRNAFDRHANLATALRNWRDQRSSDAVRVVEQMLHENRHDMLAQWVWSQMIQGQ